MGKTSKPITILVLDSDLYQSPEVQELIAKGHEVIYDTAPKFDLILGRKAWYLDKQHLKYLEKVAIPAARERVYPKEKK